MYKPTVYIAGPMTGLPLMNFCAFDEAKDRLTKTGTFSRIITPADTDRALLNKPFNWLPDPCPGPEGPWDMAYDAENNCYINMKEVWRKDMHSVIDSDAIYMLNGWEQSKGAMIELQLAALMNKDIYYENSESSI